VNIIDLDNAMLVSRIIGKRMLKTNSMKVSKNQVLSEKQLILF
jgi:hypothetical protein